MKCKTVQGLEHNTKKISITCSKERFIKQDKKKNTNSRLRQS